LRSHWFSRPAP